MCEFRNILVAFNQWVKLHRAPERLNPTTYWSANIDHMANFTCSVQFGRGVIISRQVTVTELVMNKIGVDDAVDTLLDQLRADYERIVSDEYKDPSWESRN